MTPLTNKNAVLVVGQSVYCGLYGGNHGLIYEIIGEQTPETIAIHSGVLHTGGSAYFKIVFENGSLTHVPESIVRGVQWEIYAEVATAAEIEAALQFAQAETIKENQEKELTAARRQADRERLARDYAHLERVAPGTQAGSILAAKNIRHELKAAFPGIAFSVRSDYSSVNIHWKLGPTSAEVEAIVNKYKQGSFNGMEDIYERNHDNVFPDLFGGARYVFPNHDCDEADLVTIAKALCSVYELPVPEDGKFWNLYVPKLDLYAANLATRVLLARSYPPDAIITGIENNPESPGDYRATYIVQSRTKEEIDAAHAARFTGFNRIRYGFATPGEVQEGFEMIGHYTRLSQAEEAHRQHPGSKKEGYINGFKKRGWVVFRKVPAETTAPAPEPAPAPETPEPIPANVIPMPAPISRAAAALRQLDAMGTT